MNYCCLTKQSFSYRDFELSAIKSDHIMHIRRWRNEQMNILRQKNEISEAEQISYFENYVWPTFNQVRPNQILLSFFKARQLVGYGGLVHISWEDLRGEVSFLLDTVHSANSEIYATYFANYLNLIKQVAFEDLGFNRLFTETYDLRPLHISVLESNGFILEGRMRQNNIIDSIAIDSLIHGVIKNDYENS